MTSCVRGRWEPDPNARYGAYDPISPYVLGRVKLVKSLSEARIVASKSESMAGGEKSLDRPSKRDKVVAEVLKDRLEIRWRIRRGRSVFKVRRLHACILNFLCKVRKLND